MPSDKPFLRWHAFHTHKRGNAADEYEDAFAGDVLAGRFAVADGASESSFVATWARLVAEGFVAAEGKPWHDLDWLAAARQRWAEEVDPLVLPWYAEEKREQGAYATLLGIEFRKPRTKTAMRMWHAILVGDSCLFRLRDGKIRKSFPLTRSTDFGNQPALLGSRGRAVDTPEQAVLRLRGKWRPRERFLLTTDALAEWLVRQTENRRRPGDEIKALLKESDPQGAFAGWVEERRQRQGLRNDDVTLVVIDCIG